MLEYFLDYFETSRLTGYFLAGLLVLSALKYLPKGPRTQKVGSSIGPLLLILLLGLTLRSAWIGFSSHRPLTEWGDGGIQESDWINIHAIEMTRGVFFENAEGLPSGRRPIGYPMALGGLYKVFGVHPQVPLLFHLVLYLVSAVLLYRMGDLLFGRRAGLAACLFFSVYPVSVYSVVLLVDEHLFLALWNLSLYLLLRELKCGPFPRSRLVYGLLFGAAAMTRTHAVLLPLVFVFVCLLRGVSWPRAFAQFLLVVLLMQLVNLPWVLRNQRAWGVPVLYTATNQYLYPQLNSTAGPGGGGRIPGRGEEGYSEELERARLSRNEGLYHAESGRQIVRWIAGHPGRFVLMGLERVLIFMRWDREQGVWPIWFQYYEGAYDPDRPIPQKLRDFFEEAGFAAYYALFFSALFCVFLLLRRGNPKDPFRRRALLSLGMCFLLFLMIQMAVYPDRKYRFPLEVLLMLPAGFYLQYLAYEFRWENLRLGRGRS